MARSGLRRSLRRDLPVPGAVEDPPEPVGAAGLVTPRDVVTSLYRGLLERDPAEDEIQLWLGALQGGMPLSDIVHEFASSEEWAGLMEQRTRALPPPMPDGPSLTILDIGAQRLEGEEDPFRPLLEGGNCRVIGVEPLEEAFAERASSDPSWSMLPIFAGDGSTRTFYETENGPTSSLYEPNLERICDFAGLGEICTVARQVIVNTTRLDEVIDEPVHYVKLDVQGAELDVLRGAERALAGVLVIHAEVEFFPIYREQPLFDSVVRYLADHGFELFDVPRMVRYSYQPAAKPLERLLWGEAVFIPDGKRIDELGMDDTRRLARIMRDNYGTEGFARWLLERYDSRSPN